MRRAYEVAARLNAGTVFVNTYNDVDVAVPFGGVKNSGFGRENGMAALQHYVSIKYCLIFSLFFKTCNCFFQERLRRHIRQTLFAVLVTLLILMYHCYSEP